MGADVGAGFGHAVVGEGTKISHPGPAIELIGETKSVAVSGEVERSPAAGIVVRVLSVSVRRLLNE